MKCCGVAVLSVAGFSATYDAWYDLAYTGLHDEESSHVLLAPIAFIWIFLARRAALQTVVVRHQWVGPLIVVAGWALWSMGYRHQLHTLWHLGAIGVLVGGIVSVYGTDLLIRFLPAFGALLFLIPMAGERRQQFSAPMQLVTARITQAICETFGMVVERQGSLITANGVAVAIAEACNGMRMVITLVIVSYLYAFTTPLRAYVRWLLLLASPVLAVVCNVIRLVPTVWMFAHTSTRTAERFHDISGWVMLLVAFGLLMLGVHLLRWLMLPVDLPPSAPLVEGLVQPC